MATSDKKIAANRANAAKSTGPKTPRGKRNSSRNGIRHGILAGVLLIQGESRENFLKLFRSLDAEYNPVTPTEIALVTNAASARWRQMRLWAIEAAGIIREQRLQSAANVSEDAPTRAALAIRSLADNSRHTELMARYESRLDRQYHRAIDRLTRMRDMRDAKAAKKEEKNVFATRSQISEQNQRHDMPAKPTGNPPETHPEPTQ